MHMFGLGMKLQTDRLTPQWNRLRCSSRDVSAAHTEPLFSQAKFDFKVLYVAVLWWEKFSSGNLWVDWWLCLGNDIVLAE